MQVIVHIHFICITFWSLNHKNGKTISMANRWNEQQNEEIKSSVYSLYAIDYHCQCQGKYIHKHDFAALGIFLLFFRYFFCFLFLFSFSSSSLCMLHKRLEAVLWNFLLPFWFFVLDYYGIINTLLLFLYYFIWLIELMKFGSNVRKFELTVDQNLVIGWS